MRKSIGLDIGGTKIACGICTEEGQLLGKVEVPTRTDNKETVFSSVQQAIHLALEQTRTSLKEIKGIGVGVPGKVDRTRGIAVYQNNLPWKNFPVVSALQEALSIEHVVLDNDVYMAAYAEWNDAGARKDQIFSYITVSTGISSSSIMNGSFIQGAGFAGELGLIPVYSSLRKSEAVPVDRLEFTSSGFHLQELGRERLQNKQLTTKDLFAAYHENKPESVEIIQAAALSIAHGLYSLICLLDPHRIHFGGSVMIHNPFFLDLILERLEKLMLPEQKHILDHIYLSRLGQNNGVLGAGMRIFENGS